MSTTINFPRDTTMQQLVAAHKAQILAGGDAAAIDGFYNTLARQSTGKACTDALFAEWWGKVWKRDGSVTRLELLERWFGTVLDDERVHGVKLPLFATAATPTGELTDDSAGLVCVPSTASTAGRDDFAGLPQFWCCEVSLEKTAGGGVEVFAVEFVDDIDTVRDGTHLCMVLQKNTWRRDIVADGYHVIKTRCHQSAGYQQWRQGKTADGVTHAFIGNPKYMAGKDAAGKMTCGTGLAPVLYTAGPTTGVGLWRQRGAQYAGASGCVLYWQQCMIALKYATKGNSGVIEGCSAYNYQYTAAAGESGVQRVLLTAAQAGNLLVGSTVNVGNTATATDRGNAANYNIAKLVTIESITDAVVGGVAYKAVNINNGGVAFDTVAGGTLITTMPYTSGWNDGLLGNDGSRYSCTNGKEPGAVQKTEFQNGAYLILADELWQWGKGADGNFTFDSYLCENQAKVTTNGTLSADYKKLEGLTMTFPATQGNGWLGIEDVAPMPGGETIWPLKASSAAGSGNGCKAGFCCSPAASGLRAGWCCDCLIDGWLCGVAARYSNASVGNASWGGGLGSPSLAG